jgi:hypothetical protein
MRLPLGSFGVFAACLGLVRAADHQALPQLVIKPNSTTVGGFGYGGDMAVQAHIAFSSHIKGLCGFAAQPFYCAVQRFTQEPTVVKKSGSGVPHCDGCDDPLTTLRFDHCRASPEVVDVGKLPDWPRRHCGHPPRANCLDDVVNIYQSKVYLQSGTKDQHTPKNAVVNTFAFYAQMLYEPQIQVQFDGSVPLGHEMPTNHSATPFDGPWRCLGHLYGPTVAPAGNPMAENLQKFPQANFTKGGAGWADEGLIYIPSACKRASNTANESGTHTVEAECKLHLLLHDCGTRAAPALPPKGTTSESEDEFAKYAETNNIVLLMPRLEAKAKEIMAVTTAAGANTSTIFAPLETAVDVDRGCWDVFGQLGANYPLQSSPHMAPLLAMIRAVSGMSAASRTQSGTSDAVAVDSISSAVDSISSAWRAEKRARGNAADDVVATRAANAAAATVATRAATAAAAIVINSGQPLPRLAIDSNLIMSNGASSGGDMAIQFHVSFSALVNGVCGFDAQPFHCAATRFPGDALLPQTPESSAPHCFGCPDNTTILYDHCKSHAHWVSR